MHHAPAAQVLHPHRCFEPMSKLQHGLSSSAANVKETTGLLTGCFTLTRASPDDTHFYMRLLLPKAHNAWTRYCMLMDTQFVNTASERLPPCNQPGPLSHLCATRLSQPQPLG